jgi:hypothetical protein
MAVFINSFIPAFSHNVIIYYFINNLRENKKTDSDQFNSDLVRILAALKLISTFPLFLVMFWIADGMQQSEFGLFIVYLYIAKNPTFHSSFA